MGKNKEKEKDKQKYNTVFRSFFEIRYNSLPSFFDKKGSYIQKIIDEVKYFTEWKISESRVDFGSRNEEDLIANGYITNLNYGLTTAKMESTEEIQKLIKNFLKTCWNIIPPENYTRIGFRTMTLVPVDRDFDSLVKQIGKKSFSTDLLREFPVKDLAVTIDSEEDDFHTHIQYGPMLRKQAVSEFGLKPDEIAEVSLFVDIDLFKVIEAKRLKQSSVMQDIERYIEIRKEKLKKLSILLNLGDVSGS